MSIKIERLVLLEKKEGISWSRQGTDILKTAMDDAGIQPEDKISLQYKITTDKNLPGVAKFWFRVQSYRWWHTFRIGLR